MFSIIVPIYNVEKYLKECLDSILSQTYENYEIICINDASTDASYEILLDYQENSKKIITINNEVNKGQSYCRNRAIEIARGDYIWFVDSDDYIKQNSLECLMKALENQQIDILHFNYLFLNESLYRKNNTKEIDALYQNSKEIMTGKQWFLQTRKDGTFSSMACNKLFRKDFLLNHNLFFYEDIVYEDMLFNMKALMSAEKVMNISDNLYVYRLRDGSTTLTWNTHKLDSMVIVMNELLYLWKESKPKEAMNEALLEYIKNMIPTIKRFMLCFPEHKKMEIGNPEDQFFYELLLNSNMIVNHYVNLNLDEIEKMKKFKKVIVYGAGNVAAELFQVLDIHNIDIDAVAVTNKEGNPQVFGKYTIYQIEELLNLQKEALVIVAVVSRKQEAIKEHLLSLGFGNIMLLNADKGNFFYEVEQ